MSAGPRSVPRRKKFRSQAPECTPAPAPGVYPGNPVYRPPECTPMKAKHRPPECRPLSICYPYLAGAAPGLIVIADRQSPAASHVAEWIWNKIVVSRCRADVALTLLRPGSHANRFLRRLCAV
jgi:hypothetical protein